MVLVEPPEVWRANDIARQFAHLGPEAAAPHVADHLRAFWDPRMRAALLAAAGDPAARSALHPAVLAAAHLLAEAPAPDP